MLKWAVPLALIVGILYRAGAFRPWWKHKHQCTGCRTIWEHDPQKSLTPEAHQCPGCGKERRLVYYGSEPAQIARWGER